MDERLVPWARRRPAAALAAADRLGRLRNALSRRWPSAGQVGALFPGLDRGQAADVARRIGGGEARNRLLVACLRRYGLAWLRPLVRVPREALAALRPPLLLVTFHVGAMHALGPALERLPGPVLVLRQGPLYEPAPPVAIESVDGDEQRRALSFHRALGHLDDGFVVTALDLMPQPGAPAPCLGRTLEIARGPLALARLTGAPLVPIVARWRRQGMEAEVELDLAAGLAADATSGPAAERDGALAAAAALWLERYLRRDPAAIGLGLLRALLGLTPPDSPSGPFGTAPPPGAPARR